MKAILFLLLVSLSSQILYAQTVCNNISPVAIAGNDTIIHNNQTSCVTPLPITITLNGSRSFDPDGIIVSYVWTGPSGISNPNAAITNVTGLLPGTYTFILEVTDNSGAFAHDTIHISIIPGNRPLIPVRLIPIGTLSQPRYAFTVGTGSAINNAISIGAAGNKILFAGGETSNVCATTRVDIYDVVSGNWTISELSQARFGAAAASLGNKIFFAGGIVPLPGPPGPGCYFTNMIDTRTSVIDIYDVSTNTWSIAQLSSPRFVSGAAINNKVLFAGGDAIFWQPNNRADVYDAGTNGWSIDSISIARVLDQPAKTNDKIYFPGGSADFYGVSGGWATDRIDIYNSVSNSWQIDSLSRVRTRMGNIIANNKLYCGGGWVWDSTANWWNPTNSVEIRDLVSNTITFDCLSEPRIEVTALRKNNSLVFTSSWSDVNTLDILDLTTNSWSVGVLPQILMWPVYFSYNNNIYVTEGNEVWQLEFDNCTNGSSSVITTTACDKYTLNGHTYVGSGMYTQRLTNAAGCDSIITLNLTINYSTHCTTTATACDSFTWQGKTYTSSGFYNDTLVSSNGCDSILSLALTINNKSLTIVNAAICSGQIYEGHTTTGTYSDTLIAANGCDSIRTLNLTVKPGSFSTINTEICSGQTYAGYTTSGTYTDIFIAANGCDSVRTLNLSVKNNCGFYIPNTFTPNKDGLNDLFKPTINLTFSNYYFVIFNRYGEKIFETKEYGKGWDGTYKGKDQLSGSYVYRITFTNISGYVSENNGTVLLIR